MLPHRLSFPLHEGQGRDRMREHQVGSSRYGRCEPRTPHVGVADRRSHRADADPSSNAVGSFRGGGSFCLGIRSSSTALMGGSTLIALLCTQRLSAALLVRDPDRSDPPARGVGLHGCTFLLSASRFQPPEIRTFIIGDVWNDSARGRSSI